MKKNSLFPYRTEKNKMSLMKLKVNFFEALFPGSFKGLQITQNLTCTKHVDLLLTSSELSVNDKIRKIHRNICKD